LLPLVTVTAFAVALTAVAPAIARNRESSSQRLLITPNELLRATIPAAFLPGLPLPGSQALAGWLRMTMPRRCLFLSFCALFFFASDEMAICSPQAASPPKSSRIKDASNKPNKSPKSKSAPSLQEFRSLQKTFSEYLISHRDQFSHQFPPDLVPLLTPKLSEPLEVTDGQAVRLGVWRFYDRFGKQSLCFRPVPGPFEFSAGVKCIRGKWSIDDNLYLRICQKFKPDDSP
jgi:hypothetical protein